MSTSTRALTLLSCLALAAGAALPTWVVAPEHDEHGHEARGAHLAIGDPDARDSGHHDPGSCVEDCCSEPGTSPSRDRVPPDWSGRGLMHAADVPDHPAFSPDHVPDEALA